MEQNTFNQSSTHTGSCLCEAVKYRVDGPAKLQYLCHCRNCQKLSGAAFNANCFFDRASFKVTQGDDKLRIYHCKVTGSGCITHRHFCSECGSALFILPESRPTLVVVMGGTLDDFDAFVPTQEFFVKDRRTWVKQVEGADAHERARPANSGL